jgi:hypothetical protein
MMINRRFLSTVLLAAATAVQAQTTAPGERSQPGLPTPTA